MLALTWAIYDSGSVPQFWQFYAVYFGASFAGALTAGLVYALLKPGATFFGTALRGSPKQKTA